MISPLSSSSQFGAGPSASALTAQLQRYQKQLSDCVNCPSANTPESRTTAELLSNKIAETRQLIEKVTTPGPAAQSKETATGAQNTSNPAHLGNHVNVFA